MTTMQAWILIVEVGIIALAALALAALAALLHGRAA